MWTKPYGMKEGFLIGGGLILIGLMLELSVGPVDWDAFRWPVNGIVLAGFLVLIAIIFLLSKKVYGLQFIGTYKAAIPTLVYAVVLTIIMGLTRQEYPAQFSPLTGGVREGPGLGGLNHMLSFWPFVLIYVYMAVILGLVVLRQLRMWAVANFSLLHSFTPSLLHSFTPSLLHSFTPSLLSHLGLFLAMTTATLGNADVQRLKMITVKGEPEWRALTSQHQIVELPFSIELKEFIMETYDDGSPRRFASDIQILTKTGKNIQTTVEVNNPVEVDGWKIYQYGYDTQMGAMSQYSILELVSDPWLPLVYTGIYMMLGGAVCMFLFGGKKKIVNRKSSNRTRFSAFTKRSD